MILRSAAATVTWLLLLPSSLAAVELRAESQSKFAERWKALGDILYLPGDTPTLIGRGFDSVTQLVADPCIAFDPKHEDTYLSSPVPLPGNSATVVLERIENSFQLDHVYSGNISISGAFKGGTAGLNMSRAGSEHRSNYHLYFLIGLEVVNQPELLIKTEPLDSVATLRGDAFVRKCGTLYAAGRITGGQYLGVLDLDTEKGQRIDQFAADVKADVGQWFSGEASYKDRIETLVTKNHLSIRVVRRGGTRTSIITTPEQFRLDAQAWAAQLDPSAKPVQPGEKGDPTANLFRPAILAFVVSKYRHPGSEIPEHIHTKERYAERVTRAMSAATQLEADRMFVRAHPEYFNLNDAEEFEEAVKTFDAGAFRDHMKALWDRCYRAAAIDTQKVCADIDAYAAQLGAMTPEQEWWREIGAKNATEQPIGIVRRGEVRAVRIDGNFNLHSAPFPGLYHEGGFGLWVIVKKWPSGDVMKEEQYFSPRSEPLTVGDRDSDFSVFVQVRDIFHPDNWSDGLRATLARMRR